MKIDNIYEKSRQFRKNIDLFLNREIFGIQGFDAKITTTDYENYIIEFYDQYGSKKIEFSKKEFLSFIHTKIDELESININEILNIEEAFCTFISKKILNILLQ